MTNSLFQLVVFIQLGFLQYRRKKIPQTFPTQTCISRDFHRLCYITLVLTSRVSSIYWPRLASIASFHFVFVPRTLNIIIDTDIDLSLRSSTHKTQSTSYSLDPRLLYVRYHIFTFDPSISFLPSTDRRFDPLTSFSGAIIKQHSPSPPPTLLWLKKQIRRTRSSHLRHSLCLTYQVVLSPFSRAQASSTRYST